MGPEVAGEFSPVKNQEERAFNLLDFSTKAVASRLPVLSGHPVAASIPPSPAINGDGQNTGERQGESRSFA